jgi:hypothetical protein
MKRATLTFLILLSTAALFAPAPRVIDIARPAPLNIYDRLIAAIYEVESGSGKYLFNFKELARGPLQIRPIRLRDYNQRTGKNYLEWDCYDFEISREIFLYFAKGKSYEQAARDWNGKWSLTEGYWQKVKNKLE